MNKSVNASRIVSLLVLLIAAIVVLSGPVAQVLDLPEPTAEAKKKHKHKKKKKKKNRPPAFNVVQCPTEGEDSITCNGTPANDSLIGGPEDRPFGAFDSIFGGEGTDVYNGGNGSDVLTDDSTASNDVYLFPATPFSDGLNFQTFIQDSGGGGDVVNLGSHSISDFTVFRDVSFDDTLFLDGPGDRDIEIRNFFDGENFGFGKMETFLFSGGAVTGDEVASRVAF